MYEPGRRPAHRRAVEKQILDLCERNMAAADVFSRTEICAPIAGAVVGMKVSTLSGIIALGELLVDTVPADDAHRRSEGNAEGYRHCTERSGCIGAVNGVEPA
ncbi:MAG: hypothetical protein EVA87_00820 [Rhodospirillaceae bacterium]|nr:MAG: hypothetical protein EVA87_00820 [Rhodospirillaceae bacterium]